MHYSGAAAAKFIYVEGGADLIPKSQTEDSQTAVISSIAASMIFICGISLITTADLRAWYYNKTDLILQTEKIVLPLFKTDNGDKKCLDAFEKYKDLHPSFSEKSRSYSDKIGNSSIHQTSHIDISQKKIGFDRSIDTSQQNVRISRSSKMQSFDTTTKKGRLASFLSLSRISIVPEGGPIESS